MRKPITENFKWATCEQIGKLYLLGVSVPDRRTYKEAQFIIDNNNSKDYNRLLIIVRFNNGAIKGCKVTARSRRECEQKYKLIQAIGGTNITFDIYEV